jgi:hypothetical protein
MRSAAYWAELQNDRTEWRVYLKLIGLEGIEDIA